MSDTDRQEEFTEPEPEAGMPAVGLSESELAALNERRRPEEEHPCYRR